MDHDEAFGLGELLVAGKRRLLFAVGTEAVEVEHERKLGRALVGGRDVHPDVVRSHWSGKGDALEAIQRVTLWSRHFLTGRVRQATRAVRP